MRVSDWNYLRKRLISAKVKEQVETNQVKVRENSYNIITKIGAAEWETKNGHIKYF